MRLFTRFFLFVFVVIFSPLVAAQSLYGRVVGVSDGDTITVLVEKEKRPVKVRLAEIDTPESRQPWGTKAKQALSRLVFGKNVRVEVQTTDRYGRAVAHVYRDDLWVNAKMVEDGHAWVYRNYSKNPVLLQLEAEARAAKRGLWSLPESERMPPWEWRHGGKSASEKNFLPKEQNGDKSYACGTKTTCRQMASCNEAMFYYRQCGVLRLDRDRDGVPCESLCR